MKSRAIILVARCFLVALAVFGSAWEVRAEEPAARFQPLFNGKNLSGWINVNTDKDTWKMQKGVLTSTGKPIGILCTERQYENFVLHVEWKHLEAGGNSGVFMWADGVVPAGKPFPRGLEVQMLDIEWPELNKDKEGKPRPIAYAHGELFGVEGLTITPDNPRGVRSMSIENRVLGKGLWNVYDVVAVDGTVKLAINGKFVNGISKASVKKGHLCLEAEGAPIHFRNLRILELPPGVTTAEQTGTVLPKP